MWRVAAFQESRGGAAVLSAGGGAQGRGGGDAARVRGGLQRGFLADAAHGCMGALAGGAAGSVSNRDKARPQRLEPLDRGPQPLVHVRRLRREELEGNARRAGVKIADRVGRKQAAR